MRQELARMALACIGRIGEIRGQQVFDLGSPGADRLIAIQETSRSIIRDGGTDEGLRFVCGQLADLVIEAGIQ